MLTCDGNKLLDCLFSNSLYTTGRRHFSKAKDTLPVKKVDQEFN